MSWWETNVVKPIHNMRIPLSARGQNIMGGVYFTVPLVAGYFLYQWTEKQAAINGMRYDSTVRGARPMALPAKQASRAAEQLRQSNKPLNDLLEGSQGQRRG
jgi:hypothetical protein